MTTPDAIALPDNAIVRHKRGKLYRVRDVATQQMCYRNGGREFSTNPYRDAYLSVYGQRNGKDFGPIRTLRASDCTLIAAEK